MDIKRKPTTDIAKVSPKRFSAFTLVELIVVITILAILATIGFLALSGYSQDAKDSAIKANVRSVMTAISSESTITNNSPRYYVVHDAAAALTGSAVAYVNGSPTVLAGGDWNVSGTNYSAGNPDWVKLKLNPNKFKLSALRSGLAAAFGTAEAAYDPKFVSVGAIDVTLAPTASWRRRSTSFFQVVGIAPSIGLVSISGDYPTGHGGVTGLVKNPNSQGIQDALVENAAYYPGCDTADIVLSNGQRWAACNVGASTAFVGQTYPSWTVPNGSQKAYLWAFFQWGRNEDATSLTTGPRVSTGSPTTVLGYFAIGTASYYDWLADAAQNGNLWWGGATSLGSGFYSTQVSADQIAMKGPCATGYHVPTQAEWYAAISTLNSSVVNSNLLQDDVVFRDTLKIPLSGNRDVWSAAYDNQGLNGKYWSSTPNWTSTYDVIITPSQVRPANSTSRWYGKSVRCLAN